MEGSSDKPALSTGVVLVRPYRNADGREVTPGEKRPDVARRERPAVFGRDGRGEDCLDVYDAVSPGRNSDGDRRLPGAVHQMHETAGAQVRGGGVDRQGALVVVGRCRAGHGGEATAIQPPLATATATRTSAAKQNKGEPT